MSFLVEDARGEPLALASTREMSEFWVQRAREYFEEAVTSGHPNAPRWVHERLPINVREIDEAERDRVLEDGAPLLQREP